MQKTLFILFFINCPIVIGIATTADTLVYTLLTEKWEQCIPYIRLLCISGLIFPLHVVNGNAILSIGQSGLILKLEIIKKGLTVMAIAITFRWGIEAIIMGQVFQNFFAFLINAYYSKRFFEYSYLAQLRDVLPYLLISALMGFCVYLIGMIPIENPAIMLWCQVLAGICIYIITSYFFRLEAFGEVSQIARSFFTIRGKRTVAS
jgi:O-antigen/teichoic acid export membrane protein